MNEDFYISKEGDTLMSISLRFLGDERLFPLLEQLNGIKAKDLAPGMTIMLHPDGLEPEK